MATWQHGNMAQHGNMTKIIVPILVISKSEKSQFQGFCNLDGHTDHICVGMISSRVKD